MSIYAFWSSALSGMILQTGVADQVTQRWGLRYFVQISA